ncbi:MAG: hypothetical protein S4CHLAM45_15030 [Chlamydiales bacterium]|nr:hypothetical protein [Chlamydiales bacterium]MCH9620120.1 hypothetical protein [Chlamydiales bacterium]MCH9623590.1 hypothetical protein [Chlamydiales bacterium]
MALLKFFHVFFVFIWMGTLITVGRFVASQKEENQELSRISKRLYLFSDLPAMCLAILTGLTLLLTKEGINFKAPWLHLKLTFAVILIGCDIVTGRMIIKGCFGSKWLKSLHYIVVTCLLFVLLAIYVLKEYL